MDHNMVGSLGIFLVPFLVGSWKLELSKLSGVLKGKKYAKLLCLNRETV